MRKGLPAGAALSLVLALGALGSGCSVLDREQSSLVFARNVHRYDDLAPAEKEFVREQETSPDPYHLEGRVELVSGDMRPFKPFAYCYLHESNHIPESIVAVSAAPVEYPIAFATHTTVTFIQAMAGAIERFLDWLFPDRALPPAPRRKEDDKSR